MDWFGRLWRRLRGKIDPAMVRRVGSGVRFGIVPPVVFVDDVEKVVGEKLGEEDENAPQK